MAAALLSEFGASGIVSYLAARRRECIDTGDMKEADRWMTFTLKIEALMGTPDSGPPQ